MLVCLEFLSRFVGSVFLFSVSALGTQLHAQVLREYDEISNGVVKHTNAA